MLLEWLRIRAFDVIVAICWACDWFFGWELQMKANL
jgi:hypothetical protein